MSLISKYTYEGDSEPLELLVHLFIRNGKERKKSYLYPHFWAYRCGECNCRFNTNLRRTNGFCPGCASRNTIKASEKPKIWDDPLYGPSKRKIRLAKKLAQELKDLDQSVWWMITSIHEKARPYTINI